MALLVEEGVVFIHSFTDSVCAVLPFLLPLVTCDDTCLRHGALHAVAETSFALFEMALKEDLSFSQYIGPLLTTQLLQVAPRVSSYIHMWLIHITMAVVIVG